MTEEPPDFIRGNIGGKMTEETQVNGKTIIRYGWFGWVLLFLVAVIAFGIMALWIRVGNMMDPNHPYMSAIHGVYISETGRPELKMIRVDNSGFIGVIPVQKLPNGTKESPVPQPQPVPVQPQAQPK